MKEAIIEQMRSLLSPERFCQSDFEYDVKALENTNEPFLWMVRDQGTSLVKLGAGEMRKHFHYEQLRMELMRNAESPLSSFKYLASLEAKFYYYDGLELRQIKKADTTTIYLSLWGDSIKTLPEFYPTEYAAISKPLELRMASEQVAAKFKRVKEVARDLHDTSFMACMERLKSWTRRAVDQHIEISDDFTENSFSFCEITNGTPGINGGVIYSSYAKENRWSTHT